MLIALELKIDVFALSLPRLVFGLKLGETMSSNLPPDSWIERHNQILDAEGIEVRARPVHTWIQWSIETDSDHGMDSPGAKRIHQWYEEHFGEKTFHIPPIFVGLYYFDQFFWPIRIPVVFGRVVLKLENALEDVPVPTRARMLNSPQCLAELDDIWKGCIDYGMGIRSLGKDEKFDETYGGQLLIAADRQLNATVTLLRERVPNPRAGESSRFAVETFLKAYLAINCGLTDEKARSQYGHDLSKALAACISFNPSSDLAMLGTHLNAFPLVSERYSAGTSDTKQLWLYYEMAQWTGTTVVREIGGRDTRRGPEIRTSVLRP